MTFRKHPRFVVRESSPYNGGPPLDILAAARLTPIEAFFVRNHAAVPEVDPATFRLRVEGLVERPRELSLDDLRTWYRRREVEAATMCAGNRRGELQEVAPIPGELSWGSEAVGNAVWSGFALADVLRDAGLEAGARHVAFEGLDACARNGASFPFGGSIPLEKGLGAEVLLADTMNGAPLEAVHGSPLRAVVPGYVGARSVKWLARIVVQEQPSTNYFQRKAYRLLPPEARPGDERGTMLGDFPVNAVIAAPESGARLAAGRCAVVGIALAGGGRRIARVEVSIDGGATWATAAIEPPDSPWAWTRFRAQVDLAPGETEIVARAWDEAGHTQPERAATVWNAKGYVNNAWARVRVGAM